MKVRVKRRVHDKEAEKRSEDKILGSLDFASPSFCVATDSFCYAH